nr:MAG TPA: hypothetical protein [Caudoviricetes sp.]
MAKFWSFDFKVLTCKATASTLSRNKSVNNHSSNDHQQIASNRRNRCLTA